MKYIYTVFLKFSLIRIITKHNNKENKSLIMTFPENQADFSAAINAVKTVIHVSPGPEDHNRAEGNNGN